MNYNILNRIMRYISLITLIFYIWFGLIIQNLFMLILGVSLLIWYLIFLIMDFMDMFLKTEIQKQELILKFLKR